MYNNILPCTIKHSFQFGRNSDSCHGLLSCGFYLKWKGLYKFQMPIYLDLSKALLQRSRCQDFIMIEPVAKCIGTVPIWKNQTCSQPRDTYPVTAFYCIALYPKRCCGCIIRIIMYNTELYWLWTMYCSMFLCTLTKLSTCSVLFNAFTFGISFERSLPRNIEI